MDRKTFQNLPAWLKQNVFYRGKLNANNYVEDDKTERVKAHPLDANLISSEKITGKHALLLDLDVDTVYAGSTTTGHSHLYIDANLELDALKEIVDVLSKHGILGEGIKQQLENRGCLTLRPPGVKKGTDDDLGPEEYKAKPEKIEQTKKTFEPHNKYAKGGEVYLHPLKQHGPQFEEYKSWHPGGYVQEPTFQIEKHEKYANVVPAETIHDWLMWLGKALPAVLSWKAYKDPTYVDEDTINIFATVMDKTGWQKTSVIATGYYQLQSDSYALQFDSKTYPFDWKRLKEILGGG